MTHETRRDDRSTARLTDADFATALEALVVRARDSRVDLEGAYDVRLPDDGPDYTVEISEVVRRSE